MTKDELILTLLQIVATLNQPVQHTNLEASAILRTDARVAREIAIKAISAATDEAA